MDSRRIRTWCCYNNEDTVYSIINRDKDVPPEVPPQLFDDINEYDSTSDLYQLNDHSYYDYVIANNQEVFDILDKPSNKEEKYRCVFFS